MTKINKLKPEVKQKWLEALRSGQYEQTTGRLRDVKHGRTAFCCLGVLCNLHAQAHPEFAATQTDPQHYDGKSIIPSQKVIRWAFEGSIKDMDAGVYFRSRANGDDVFGGSCQLWELNDCNLYSFNKIADVIEHYL